MNPISELTQLGQSLWLDNIHRKMLAKSPQGGDGELETLIKRGIPSRAEITDAAMAERAECVMINKGPFVLDAIALLDDVVERMQAHQQKKTSRMRALHW